jgi:hypothetical protein
MKEAFRKAITTSPQSAIVEKIKISDAREIWDKKELAKGRETRELGDKLFALGAQWYALRIDRMGFGGLNRNGGIEELRKIWERLRAQVVVQQRGDRIILLEYLADGMWLCEERMAVAYQLLLSRPQTLDQELSSAGKLFINGFSDLSRYTPEEAQGLKNFALNDKQSDLPRVISRVADWVWQSWEVSDNRNEH